MLLINGDVVLRKRGQSLVVMQPTRKTTEIQLQKYSFGLQVLNYRFPSRV